MAPETLPTNLADRFSLQKKILTLNDITEDNDLAFSEKSDVWSYGVTLWEIYTLGRAPNKSTRQVKNGMTLDIPTSIPEPYPIRSVMNECWKFEPGDHISRIFVLNSKKVYTTPYSH